jgi:hypothetical protein
MPHILNVENPKHNLHFIIHVHKLFCFSYVSKNLNLKMWLTQLIRGCFYLYGALPVSARRGPQAEEPFPVTGTAQPRRVTLFHHSAVHRRLRRHNPGKYNMYN